VLSKAEHLPCFPLCLVKFTGGCALDRWTWRQNA